MCEKMDLRFGYESGAGRPFGAVWDSFICHVADMQPASCFYILKFLYNIKIFIYGLVLYSYNKDMFFLL